MTNAERHVIIKSRGGGNINELVPHRIIPKERKVVEMVEQGEVLCSCGSWIEEDDVLDIEIDGDYVVLFKTGHCTECDKEYKWHEQYQYQGYYKLKEN